MTLPTYLSHLARLALTQEEAGAFFGYSRRTGQRWAAEGPPLAVAMLLAAGVDRPGLEQLARKAARG